MNITVYPGYFKHIESYGESGVFPVYGGKL